MKYLMSFTLFCAGCGSLPAATVFSNLGAGNTFTTNAAQVIRGSGAPGGFVNSAVFFTPTANYTLTNVIVALSLISGTNSVQMILANDASGSPGSTLESWTVTSLLPFGGPFPAQNLTSVGSPIVLLQGTKYWIYGTAIATNTSVTWNVNNTGQTGYFTETSAGGPWTSQPSAATPAFAANGTLLPEPRAVVLLGSGLIALLALRFRRA